MRVACVWVLSRPAIYLYSESLGVGPEEPLLLFSLKGTLCTGCQGSPDCAPGKGHLLQLLLDNSVSHSLDAKCSADAQFPKIHSVVVSAARQGS